MFSSADGEEFPLSPNARVGMKPLMDQPLSAEARQLGALRVEYSLGGGLGKAALRGGLALLGALALFFGGVFFQSLPGPANPKPEAQRGLQIVLIVCGAVLFGGALAFFLPAYLGRHGRVLVFDLGIVYLRRGKPQVFRWDEVEEFWEFKGAAHGMYMHYCQVVLNDGQKFVVTEQELKDAEVEALRGLVREEVRKSLWPRLVAAFNAGETVRFGKMEVNSRGLRWQDGFLAWDKIHAVEFDEKGHVQVTGPGKRLRLSAHFDETPNVSLFVALVNGFLRERQPPAVEKPGRPSPADILTKVCPICKEHNKPEATVCRYCGETFARERPGASAKRAGARSTPLIDLAKGGGWRESKAVYSRWGWILTGLGVLLSPLLLLVAISKPETTVGALICCLPFFGAGIFLLVKASRVARKAEEAGVEIDSDDDSD
jgi:hypothetical protein